MARSEILVGVEVGTSKVCAVVAESMRNEDLRILGAGLVPSKGVRKGEVVDLKLATECLHDALSKAEMNSNIEIDDVAVAITGSHIASFTNRGGITIPEGYMAIDEQALRDVAIKAREVSLPDDHTFLHSIIQHYYVDNQPSVLNPLGLIGRRLEADVHIIHGAKARVQNTLRCVDSQEVKIEEVVSGGLASSHAVLNDNQREMGALLIDIGGGVSDYIVFTEGVVNKSGVLAVGGDHVNNDISLGLRIPLTRAEKLKIEEGSALIGQSLPGEKITLKNDAGFSGKEIEREMLNTIIHARIEEMFTLIHKQVMAGISVHELRAGVFLTGGCSLLRGIREVAESVFDLPVHLAHDTGVSGPTPILNNPVYSTAIGVARFVQTRRAEEGDPSPIRTVWDQMKKLFGMK